MSLFNLFLFFIFYIVSIFRIKQLYGKRFKTKQKALIYTYVLPLIGGLGVLILFSSINSYLTLVLSLMLYCLIYGSITIKSEKYFMNEPEIKEITGGQNFKLCRMLILLSAFLYVVSPLFLRTIISTFLMIASAILFISAIYLYIRYRMKIKSI